MMKSIVALLIIALSTHTGLGLTNPTTNVRSTASRSPFVNLSSQKSLQANGEFVNAPVRHPPWSSLAGFVMGTISFVGQVTAVDDYELAELPPPYIPALFGVALLAGVGVLTSSLGNVMDEEAGLGMQSGARAKKEIERSRSSYFGKRPK